MDFLSNELSKSTIVFGSKLWVVIGIAVGALIVLILFCLSICLASRKKSSENKKHGGFMVSKTSNVNGLMNDRARQSTPPPHRVLNRSNNSVLGKNNSETENEVVVEALQRDSSLDRVEKQQENRTLERTRQAARQQEETRLEMANRVRLPPVEKGVVEGERRGPHHSHERGSSASNDSRSTDSPSSAPTGISVPEVSHLGWGHWYTLRELEAATDSFSDTNVLGEGGYGIVYLGHLPDGTRIAVKNLLNNRYAFLNHISKSSIAFHLCKMEF